MKRMGQGTVQPGDSPTRELRALRAGLVLLTVCAFLPALSCGFIDYDDPQYITSNPVMHMDWTAAARQPVQGLWHPLTTLSLWVEYQLWNGSPLGFHLTNLLLHAVNVVLLFELLRRATARLWPAAVVAAMWAVHPLRVESVVWVVERKDVLAGMFGLLALAAYGRYRKSGRWQDYGVMLLPWALSMLAKPMFMALPFLLLILDFWPLQAYRGEGRAWPRWRRLILEKVPLVVVAAGAMLAILALSQTPEPPHDEALSRMLRWANAPLAVWRYLWHHVWCAQLAPYYPISEQPAWSLTAAAVVGVLGLVYVAWRVRGRRPFLLAGLLWFLVGVGPVIGIFRVGREVALADRYTYLPGIGVIAAVVYAWPTHARRRLGLAAAGAALVVLAGLTFRQAGYWRDSLTLYARTVAVTSADNYVALNAYAGALHRANRDVEARTYAQRVLQIRPQSVENRRMLGDILVSLGELREATAQLERVVVERPSYAEGHVSFGDAWLKSKQPDRARAAYATAAKLDPESGPAWGGLGDAYAALGNAPKAAEAYDISLKLVPDNVHVLINFGQLLMDNGRGDLALPHLERAVRLAPASAVAHNNFGAALASVGRRAEAAGEFEQALRLDPTDESVRRNLAILRGSGR